jgi:L-iditol 2-dehydrogenase
MLATGQIDLEHVLNRVAPLEDWKSCFDEMHSGNLVKAVLKP